MSLRIYFPVFVLFLAFSNLFALDTPQEALIKKKTEAFVESFNQHDPNALAAFWAGDGEYTNPESGEVIQGRAQIAAAYKSRFQEAKEIHLEVKIGSISFPSKDEAIAVGVFRVTQPGGEPKESAFKTFFENQNGEWLISEIRDVDIAAVPDQYQHLKVLEWLIGDWVDEDEDVKISSSYHWNATKNFILGGFTVVTEGKLELEGTQVIGWDPIKKKIRSWVFDTDGTFGESTWTKKDRAWVVETAQTLADGTRASAINIYRPIDPNSYSWESTGREVGGKILPDINPLVVKRKKV